MAGNNTIKYTLDFTSNLHDTQNQLNALSKSLKDITKMGFDNIDTKLQKGLDEASVSAIKLEKHLKNALNQDTGKLDMGKLSRSLKSSGDSLTKLTNSFKVCGERGSQAFMELSRTIAQAQAPIKQTNELMSKLWSTMGNTMRWQISSSVLNSLTSAFRSAYDYSKELDQTFVKIKTVADLSDESLAKFSSGASKIAKELKTSTAEIAKASSIYFQQGDSWSSSLRKAEITMKAVNVSFGANAEQMSEYLTAIWNSYDVGAASQELFIDKLAALGAATASSLEEISTAMEKVAATANAVGVNFDQLGSIIATVNSTTRESAETTGTAFKTIFARINDLKIDGSVIEDGFTTKLGDISSGLAEAGINVLNVNGSLKDTGVIIEDMGNSWQTMTTNQKVSIAQLVAGKRQYTQLMALFENWDKYQENLNTSMKAQGTLDRQNERAMKSINKELDELKSTTNDFMSKIFDKETIVGFIDGLTTAIDSLGKFIESFGGFGALIKQVGAIFLNAFSNRIAAGLRTVGDNFLVLIGRSDIISKRISQDWTSAFEKFKKEADFTDLQLLELSNIQRLTNATNQFTEKYKYLNNEARSHIQLQLDMIKNLQEMSNAEYLDQKTKVSAEKTEKEQKLAGTLMKTSSLNTSEKYKKTTDLTLSKSISTQGFSFDTSGLGDMTKLDTVLRAIATSSNDAEADINALTRQILTMFNIADGEDGEVFADIKADLQSMIDTVGKEVYIEVKFKSQQSEIKTHIDKVTGDISRGYVKEENNTSGTTTNTTSQTQTTSSTTTSIDNNVENSSSSTISNQYNTDEGFVNVNKLKYDKRKHNNEGKIIEEASNNLGFDEAGMRSAVPSADLIAEIEAKMSSLNNETEEGIQKMAEYEAAIKKVKEASTTDSTSKDKFESNKGKALEKREKKKEEKLEKQDNKKKLKLVKANEEAITKFKTKHGKKFRKKEEKSDEKHQDNIVKNNDKANKEKEKSDTDYFDGKEQTNKKTEDNIDKENETQLTKEEKRIARREQREKLAGASALDSAMKVGSAVMSLTSIYDTVGNAAQLWGDESATSGEKWMATLSAGANILMSMPQLISGITAAEKILGSVRSAFHKKKLAENAAESASNTVKAFTEAASKWWIAPLILALLAAGGVAAMAIGSASTSSPEESSKEASSNMSSSVEKLDEEKKILSETNKELEEKKSELEELKKLQAEGNGQHDAEISKLQQEIALLEQKKTLQEGKVKVAEQQVQNAAKVYANTATPWDTVKTFNTKGSVNVDDMLKTINEYYDSDEYAAALEAMENLDPNSDEYKKIKFNLDYMRRMSEVLTNAKAKGQTTIDASAGKEQVKEIADRERAQEQEATNKALRSDPEMMMGYIENMIKKTGTISNDFNKLTEDIGLINQEFLRGNITLDERFAKLVEKTKNLDVSKTFSGNTEAAKEYFNTIFTYGEGALESFNEQYQNGMISFDTYLERTLEVNEQMVDLGKQYQATFGVDDNINQWIGQLDEATKKLKEIRDILPDINENMSMSSLADDLEKIGITVDDLNKAAKEGKIEWTVQDSATTDIKTALENNANSYEVATVAITKQYQKSMAEAQEAQVLLNKGVEKQLNQLSFTAVATDDGYEITQGSGGGASPTDIKTYLEDKGITGKIYEKLGIYDGADNSIFDDGKKDADALKNILYNGLQYYTQDTVAMNSGRELTHFKINDKGEVSGLYNYIYDRLKELGTDYVDANGNLTSTGQQAMSLMHNNIIAEVKGIQSTDASVEAYVDGMNSEIKTGLDVFGLSQKQIDQAVELKEKRDEATENLAEAWDDYYLTKLENDLERHQRIIDEFQNQIDSLDWDIEFMGENNIKNLERELEKYTKVNKKAQELIKEYNRLLTLTPRNAEEEQAISDQITSVVDSLKESLVNVKEMTTIIGTLESSIMNNLIEKQGEKFEGQFDKISRLIEASSDENEYNDNYRDTFIKDALIGTSQKEDDAISRKEAEYEVLIEMMDEYNEAAVDKAAKAAESIAKKAEVEAQKTVTEAQKALAEIQADVDAFEKECGQKIDNIVKMYEQGRLKIQQITGDNNVEPYDTTSAFYAYYKDPFQALKSDSEGGNTRIRTAITNAQTAKVYEELEDKSTAQVPKWDYNDLINYKETDQGMLKFSLKKQKDSFTFPVQGYVSTTGYDKDKEQFYVDVVSLVKSEAGTFTTLLRVWGFDETVLATLQPGAHIVANSTKGSGKNFDMKTYIYDLAGGKHYNITQKNWYPQIDSVLAEGTEYSTQTTALTGELGPELVIFPDGGTYLAGTQGPEVLELPVGSKVYTAEETKEILGNVTTIPTDDNSNASKIWSYFKEKGFTDIATAALMGNFMQESSLNPANKGNPDAIGIAQWHKSGDRYDKFINYASQYNKDPYDLNTQLDFVYKELTEWMFEGKPLTDKLNSFDSVDEAASFVMTDYENPGDDGSDFNRKRYANDFYNTYKGTSGSTSEIITLTEDSITKIFDSTGRTGLYLIKNATDTFDNMTKDIIDPEVQRIQSRINDLSTALEEFEFSYDTKGMELYENISGLPEYLQNNLIASYQFDQSKNYADLLDRIYKSAFEEYNKYLESDYATAEGIEEWHNYLGMLVDGIEDATEKMQEAKELVYSQVERKLEEVTAISDEIEYQYQLEIDKWNKEIQARQSLIDLQQQYNSDMKELRNIESDIEKKLRQSKASVQWLDKETRDILFNQEDYYKVLQATNKIQSEISQLHAKYQGKINDLSEFELDQASLLTDEYNAQVAAKKEELSILQASLEIENKQNALNTALSERNVRVFVGGQWKQVANMNNALKAYEDYQSSINSLLEKEIENSENSAIREEEALNRELEKKIAAYEAEIAMMQDTNEKLQHEFDIMTSEFDISNVNLKKWNSYIKEATTVLEEAKKTINNNFSNTTNSSSSSQNSELIYGKDLNGNVILVDNNNSLDIQKQEREKALTEEILLSRQELEDLEEKKKEAIEKGQDEQVKIIEGKQNEIKNRIDIGYLNLEQINKDLADKVKNNSNLELKTILETKGIVTKTFSEMANAIVDIITKLQKPTITYEKDSNNMPIIVDQSNSENFVANPEPYVRSLVKETILSKQELEELEKEKQNAIEKGQDKQVETIEEKQSQIKQRIDLGILNISQINSELASFIQNNSTEEMKNALETNGIIVKDIKDTCVKIVNLWKAAVNGQNNSKGTSSSGTPTLKTSSTSKVGSTGTNLDYGQGPISDKKAAEIKSNSTLPASGLVSSILNKTQKNAKGTRNSKAGISQVNELGIELLATNSGQFIELNPHEKIFNNDQMNFLYDFSHRGIASAEKAISSVNAYNEDLMNIENITLELPNVTDTDSFVEGLKNLKSHIRNTMTIK